MNAPFTICDLPEPPRSVAFQSKDEAIGFAHDLLARICDDLIPTGVLVIGGSQYQAGKRAVADASIARRALEMTWPDMDPSAAQRVQSEDMARALSWLLHDAHAVLVAVRDVFSRLQFRCDDPAAVGRVLNAACRTAMEIERRYGPEIELAAAEGAASAERELIMRDRAARAGGMA